MDVFTKATLSKEPGHIQVIKALPRAIWTTLLLLAVSFASNGCGDVSSVSTTPAAAPAQLTIVTTSPLPDGTVNVQYSVALAASGGTPGYTWSLATNSPQLPAGLTLSNAGVISGKPTTPTVGPVNLIIQVIDSGAAQGSQQTITKTLSITVNIAPTPLTILTTSLPGGTINQVYATALGGNGGTTPYTWGLKAGSPPLPTGLTLASSTGAITGTPTVTSNATHTFTLTDATSSTVEKALTLTISAVPLSITTASLPQGTANQNYSAQLAATGGTGAYTWGLSGSSPPLPNGLALNTSSGLISGLPTGTSNVSLTFTVTDQTPPTPQTSTKTLQLIVGTAPPMLSITTNSLPSGTVLQPYTVSLASTGGTGSITWDITSGTLPTGLSLSTSGVISGTPVSTGTSTPTFRVRDSGSPQQSATKPLSITINLPAAPTITSSSPLPSGTFDVAYNQTISVSGGIGTLVWGVISGALPPGLSLNPSNGNIFGTPTSTGSFTFRLRVTDSIPQSDEKDFTITINPPAPPSITGPGSLPTGTVNQPYPNTQLTATGGAQPYSWSVSPALPNGLNLDLNTGVISGTPLSGSNGNYTPVFTVTDATFPTHQTGTRSYSLTINANVTPVSITTSSLPNGTVGQAYSGQLAASGGTTPYTFTVNSGSSLPAGLSISTTGAITGTPTAAGTTSTTFKVQDSTVPNQQTATKPISITISAAPPPLLITSSSPLPAGTENQPYSTTLIASGGTPPLTWSLASGSPSLPSGLTLSSGGVVSGTPTVAVSPSPIFQVQDSAVTPQSNQKTLTITINPASMPLTITTNSPLPSGKVGDNYGSVTPNTPVTLTATGGTPPYTWSTTVTPPLPTGLTIDTTGTISGTPTVAESNVSHTFTVTDSATPSPNSTTKALTLSIAP